MARPAVTARTYCPPSRPGGDPSARGVTFDPTFPDTAPLMALSDLFRYGAQPNLLLIITDQERSLAQWPEPYRAKLGARLKAMRRLAGHGLSFDRAYTGACMCTPSRATFLTSQYPAVTGCTTTGADSLPLMRSSMLSIRICCPTWPPSRKPPATAAIGSANGICSAATSPAAARTT